MSVGYVKLYRALSESDLWLAEPFTKGQAWVDLILAANFRDRVAYISGQEIPVNRGQLAWSEVTLSKRWEWSRGKVRRFLKLLKNDGKITQQSVQYTSLITICNYEKFQTDGTAGGTEYGTPNGTPNGTREEKGNKVKNNTPSSDDDRSGEEAAKPPKKPEPAYQEVIDLYNDLLGDFLPAVVKANEKRKRMIRARWKEVYGENSRGDDLNFWRKYFLHVRRSKPLTGTKDSFDWRPGFDWLLNETNMLKVIEGNYHHGDDRRSDLQEAS
jgi:hypothetical protein